MTAREHGALYADGVIGEPFALVTRSQVAQLVRASGAARSLWLVIAVRVSGRDGPWWIKGGARALAAEAGISERAAWGAITELRQLGLIGVQRRATPGGRAAAHAYVVLRPRVAIVDQTAPPSGPVPVGELMTEVIPNPEPECSASPEPECSASPEPECSASGDDAQETTQETPLPPLRGESDPGDPIRLVDDSALEVSRSTARALQASVRRFRSIARTTLPERLQAPAGALANDLMNAILARLLAATELWDRRVTVVAGPEVDPEYAHAWPNGGRTWTLAPDVHTCHRCGVTVPAVDGRPLELHACVSRDDAGDLPPLSTDPNGGPGATEPRAWVQAVRAGLAYLPDADLVPRIGRARDRAQLVQVWIDALHAESVDLSCTSLGRTWQRAIDPTELAERARALSVRVNRRQADPSTT